MSAEIQKMNEALRETARLQAQMRSAAGQYSDTKRGGISQIQDLVAARGGPLPNNVYSIGSGSPVPPTNINPTGLPGGIQLHRANVQAQNIFSSAGAGIGHALLGQSTYQNDTAARRDREEMLRAFASRSDPQSKAMQDIFQKMEKAREGASANLTKATEAYAKASEAGSRNLGKFAKELEEASRTFNKANRNLNEFAETMGELQKSMGDGSGGPPSGGGGGRFRNFWNNFKGMAAPAAVYAAGIGFQLAGTYSGLQATGFRQNLLAGQEIPQNIGTVEALRYQRYMATVAPTTGEQFVETYGNLLFRGKRKFQFLGLGNRENLQNTAANMVQEEFKASEAERSAATRSGIGGALIQGLGSLLAIKGGLALTVGTGGLAAVPGLALAGTGVAGLVGAGKDLYTGLTQAQTGLAGQAEGGVFNMFGAGFIHDDAKKKAELQKMRATTTLVRQEEATQRSLLDAEKQRISARKMAMGIDENLAALRMQTAATVMAGGAAVTGFEAFKGLSPERSQALAERYASLGYSIPEVGQIYNQYASMMGTTRGAGRLVGLSRAGVGSVEQMAGNILGISAVSGKTGDTKQLENIFAKAFETGLRGAPSIQRFSQAAVEMSSALKLKSAEGAATMLSTLTSALAGKTGSPLMHLGEAQAGLGALAAATGSTTGLMGTMKVLSGASQGLGMGSLGLVAGSNVVQVQEALSQVSGPVKDYTQLTGLARQLVGAQVNAGLSPEQAISKVRDVLKAQSAAQIAPFASQYEMLTAGGKLSDVQSKAKQLLKAGKSEELRNLMADFKGIASQMTGLEAEGAAEALLLVDLPASDFKKGKDILAREKGKGAAKSAADFATVNYKRVLNKAALEAQGALNRDATISEQLEAAEGLGLKGNASQRLAQLRQAAGLKEGEKMSFGKLSTAMSVISDASEGAMGSRIGILEAFGDTAINQLMGIFGRGPATKVLEDKAGTNAKTKPTSR